MQSFEERAPISPSATWQGPGAKLALLAAAIVAAAGCAAALIVTDGMPTTVIAVVLGCVLMAACLPVTLYFQGATERLLLFALVVTLPVSLKIHLLYRTEHIGGAIGLRVSVTEILLAGLIAACAWKFLRSQSLVRVEIDTPIQAALLAYLACATVSTLLGSNFDLGIYQLAAVAQAFAAFLFVTNYVTGMHRLRICILGVIVSLALQAAVAIVQVKKPGLVKLAFLGAAEETEDTVVRGEIALPNVDKGTTKIAGEMEHRPSGLMIHPNVLAAYLVLSIPAAFGAWVILNSFWMQLACLFAAGLWCVALELSLSRSGWAGLAMALLLLSWCWWKLPLLKPTPARKVVIVLAVLGGLAGIGMQAQKIYLRLTESAGDAIDFRRDLALTAWNMTKSHPFFGTGLNSFTEVMSDYDTTGMSRLKKFPVHNVFLLELSESGFTGGIAFVTLVGVMLYRMFAVCRSSGTVVYRTFAVFVACGICGFWLTQMSDYVYRIPILTNLVWFHAGLVFSAANLREEHRP